MAGIGSEYGGQPGILQPTEEQVTARGFAAPGHDWTGDASEAAMVMRRAGLKEAAGIPQELVKDEMGVHITVVGYTEEQAALDYIEGKN